MTHEYFFTIKPIENSIINRKVSITGSRVNWFKMRWIKLQRSKPRLIQFIYDYKEYSEFKSINIRKPAAGKPQSLKNVDQSLLYLKGRTVISEKRRDMMDLLKFNPPVQRDYYKNLRTIRNVESLDTPDEEDIIHIAEELITNNDIL